LTPEARLNDYPFGSIPQLRLLQANESRVLIVDSQVHIWELDRPDRPWPPGRYTPPWAYKPMSKDQLLAEMDKAGVHGAILVPPAFEGDRNDLSLQAAQQHPARFAVMGRLALDDPETKELLAVWKKYPGALGLRFTFFIPQHQRWLEDGTADWLWPAAEKAGVPLMILPVQAALPQIGAIADRHPGLRLVIDHLAVSHQEWCRDDRAFDHIEALLALACRPNIAVKASGMPEYSTEPYPYPKLHKHLRRVVETFTPRRVFWGTDFTRLQCTYRQAITMFTEEMPWLSEQDKEWIMGRGICEWLGWKMPPPKDA
jgi:predicted TIM-barrel fold metal-dependent hydrolase